MNILIFGATGMVGQGVLRECLAAADVQRVVAVGRSTSGVVHPKLAELITPNLTNLHAIEDRLAPYDACFFCLGVSSVGMNEVDYTRITYDLTLNAARTLVHMNPAMTFVYVSGAGTDSSERSRTMWARVKGRTENALIAAGFKGAYMFRPGVIRPMHAVQSKTALYRLIYTLATPVFGLLKLVSPRSLVTSVEVGQAMLTVARSGYPRPILEVADIQVAGRK